MIIMMVDNPHNGVTFCSGSYGTNLENDLPDMIRSLKGTIDHTGNLLKCKYYKKYQPIGVHMLNNSEFYLLYDSGLEHGTDYEGDGIEKPVLVKYTFKKE